MLELLITIAIIGILTAVVVPSYFAYRPKHQLNSAVNEYHSLLQNARMLAIKNRGSCSVNFAATSYTITCTTSDYTRTVNLNDYGGNIEFIRHDGASGIPGAPITFTSRGTSNTGYLHITNSQRREFYRIGPLISGVIRKDIYAGGGDWTAL